jgi:hypothetical protein
MSTNAPGRELAAILDDWAANNLTGVAYLRDGRSITSDAWEYVAGHPLISIAGSVVWLSVDEIVAVSDTEDRPFD